MADKKEGGGVRIIVKRAHGGHDASHGGAWKVAFADFVTAMMAFFLVMWIIAQGKPIREAVGGYFRDPVGFGEKAQAGILAGGKGILEHDVPPPSRDKSRVVEDEEVRAKLEQKAKELLEGLKGMPGFSEIAKQIAVELTPEGLRIQMMESAESTFFDLGGSKLSGSGLEALKMIGHTIGPLGYDMAIEGHTDSRPYANRAGYTNWELSSDRANAARRLLEDAGVSDTKITAVRGYADRQLRYADRPQDPGNRRITILVLNPFAKQAGTIPPAGVPATPEPPPRAAGA